MARWSLRPPFRLRLNGALSVSGDVAYQLPAPPSTTPFKNERTGQTAATLQALLDHGGSFGSMNGVQSGDTILVTPGTYIISASNSIGSMEYRTNMGGILRGVEVEELTIKSEVEGTPVVIDMHDYCLASNAEGDALVGIQMGINCLSLTLQDLEFRGARTENYNQNQGCNILTNYPARSGTPDGFLTMIRCKFREWDNGLKTRDDQSFTVLLVSCWFEDCGSGGLYHHNYISNIKQFTAIGCFYNTTELSGADDNLLGHLLKSRAKYNYVYGCKFDAPYGGIQCCIDLSNGGIAEVVGNIFLRYGNESYNDDNPVMKFGPEQNKYYNGYSPDFSASTDNFAHDKRTHSLLFAQNTVRQLQPEGGTPFETVKIYNMHTDYELDGVPTPYDEGGTGGDQAISTTLTDGNGSTIRNNIVGSDYTNATVFVSTYPKNTAVAHTTISTITGAYSGGDVEGDPAVNDAEYAFNAPLKAALARTDTYRGGLIAGAFDPPYALPAAGEAVLIGENTANSVKPSGLSNTELNYAMFRAYGGGTFVKSYSRGGAYVIAASGGHQAPALTDAMIFDFEDATWKLLENSSGVASRSSDYVAASELNGSPYYEISGSSPLVPSPGHLYALAVPLETENGGGTKGSFMTMTRMGVGTTGQIDSYTQHRIDLSSGAWSRFGTNTVGSQLSGQTTYFDGYALLDTETNRVYMMARNPEQQDFLIYLDLDDQTCKKFNYEQPSPSLKQPRAAGIIPGVCVFYSDIDGTICTLDLTQNNPTWVRQSKTGTPIDQNCLLVRYEPDGCFYGKRVQADGVLYKLVPPTDPNDGTWAWSTVEIGGDTMPAHTSASSEYGELHRSCLQYIPSIKCLAWFTSSSNQVCLIKPPEED